MNRISFVVAALLIPGIATLSAAVDSKSSSVAAKFGVNLVVNGDAESGPGADNDGPTLMPLPGWTRTGVFQVEQYAAGGQFSNPQAPGPDNRGKNYFTGGPDSKSNVSSATQTIDVSALAGTIKAGKSHYSFSAYLGGFSNQRDYAYVTATFLDLKGKGLLTTKIGPVTVVDRKDVTGLFLRSKSGATPKGTLKIKVTMASVRFDGLYHDGAIDNVSLSLSAD